MVKNTEFDKTFSYKLIYIFSINDDAHKGCLKIGDTSVNTDKSIDSLNPNCHDLNEAAKKRINEYTTTAGISYELLHTELAVFTVKDEKGFELKSFRDHDIHKILENSNYHKKEIGNAREWFEVDLETAKKAIKAKKNNENNLSGTNKEIHTPIIFRPEQEDAIKLTLNTFKKQDAMLWNAKMRFGKTLTALEVIKRKKFKKSIIITHRPVVDDGWYEDFDKIFRSEDNYKYGSKNRGYTLDELIKTGENFVYFSSIQDLRGSKSVGGYIDKNNEVLNFDWDFVIIDEAHEGTQTELGQNVINALIKKRPKRLELSGTPFNILDQYADDEIYTWDYVMEQESKIKWDELHFGDSNPYEELPKMHIFTYDLGKMLDNKSYIDVMDKAFNFKEFFRTWTGDVELDFKSMPKDKEVGDFVHEKDIISFLNLITKESDDSCYPFANEEYRNLFKHTFWIVPGVTEAKAFSKLLKNHPVFGNGLFNIVNVAGDGDEEDPNDEALNKVRKAIDDAGEYGYTITLSCGKLTTGVTVSEWTGVLYLSGSCFVSAASYLQTIFRAQSPCNKFGKIKTDCYVFDFAPDRTLKVVADAVQVSTKAGKSTTQQKYKLGQFLNYCPVISIDSTGMKPYDVSKMLQQLKRAYAEKAVYSGFGDTSLYNDNLMELTELDLSEFKELKEIIGKSSAQPATKKITINEQGFTEEERDRIEKLQKKPKKKRTPEEIEEIKRLKEIKKQKKAAISTLQAISIRMPLLIFGADISIDEEFKLEDFFDDDIIDSKSWDEFMPKGVSKEHFKKFIKYYDDEVFIAAGNKIRHTVKVADSLPVEERIKSITELHSYFKNPDKETVLTPWRVVNMHMSDCLGGWCFYDKTFDVASGLLENPRFIDNGVVTNNVFNENAKILEINSKTGLYQLYVAYSIYKNKIDELNVDLNIDEQWNLWLEIIKNNIFIISKTPMAKAIAKRTLLGFRENRFNAHYFDDIINQFQNKDNKVILKLLKPSYWNINGEDQMKFNAVVGNPPYQEIVSNDNSRSLAKQLYPMFVINSIKLNPDYVSLITPARWFTGNAQDSSFIKLRNFLRNKKQISKLYYYQDANEIFDNVEIKGGINYFLYETEYNGTVEFTTCKNSICESKDRYLFLDGIDIVLSDYEDYELVKKIKINNDDFESFMNITTGRNPFGIVGKEEIVLSMSESEPFDGSVELRCKQNEIRYIEPDNVIKNLDIFHNYKVFISKSAGDPKNDFKVIGAPYVGKRNTACTDSLITIGNFDNLTEAENLQKYLRTKFLRYLVSIYKSSQNVYQNVYELVPIQDFTNRSDIDWSKSVEELDNQLYLKYGLSEEVINRINSSIKEV